MSRNEQAGEGQSKGSDFLAKEHGQAWVSFYDSFDKLVQENLSRSSELLRKAMTLPEVADREIAQVRDELSNRIAQQRATSKSVLSMLSEQVTGAWNQVTNLSVALSSVTNELESIGTRVADALKALDVEDEPVKPGNPVNVDYVAALFSNTAAPAQAEPASAPVIEAVAAPAVAAAQETEPVAEEVTETVAPLAAEEIETAPEPVESSSDDAESAESDSEPTDLADRRRPHWLSVPRSGTR